MMGKLHRFYRRYRPNLVWRHDAEDCFGPSPVTRLLGIAFGTEAYFGFVGTARQGWEKIARMAATGTAEAFLATSDETKREFFALAVETSAELKETKELLSSLVAGAPLSAPAGGDREKIAQIIDPRACATLEQLRAELQVFASGRTDEERDAAASGEFERRRRDRERALSKADAILALSQPRGDQ